MSRDSTYKPITAKSAITDYLDDLLGSKLKPSAKELDEPDSISHAESEKSPGLGQNQPAIDALNSDLSPENRNEENGPKVSVTGSKLRQASTQPQKTLFRDDVKPDVLAPVVIPSSFPKFAPLPQEAVTAHTNTEPQVNGHLGSKNGFVEKKEPRRSKLDSANAIRQKVDKNGKEDSSAEKGLEIRKPQKWLENGRPAWAQKKFECLLFSVAGLKLAVPLISLGAIYQIDNDLTPLVGRASWFLGLHRSADRNVQVVDTARWVMPDRCSKEIVDGYQFVIRLGGNNWGMACDSVEEAIQLEPSQVKWRTQRGKRPWLSGTVIDHMCALLDADSLSYLLEQQKNEHT